MWLGLGNIGKKEANPYDDHIVWSDENLAHIFLRLFEFSIRFPRDMFE